jgi:hypothetical protein
LKRLINNCGNLYNGFCSHEDEQYLLDPKLSSVGIGNATDSSGNQKWVLLYDLNVNNDLIGPPTALPKIRIAYDENYFGSMSIVLEVDNATSVSIDGGIGDVTGKTRVIVPNITKIYTITATNSKGSTSKKVPINIYVNPYL